MLGLLLLLTVQTTFAQSPWSWQQRYGEPGQEVCRQVLPLKDGGYLLIGTQEVADKSTAQLYLVRTDAQGQQVWSRSHIITETSDLTILPPCENAAGQVLLSIGITPGTSSAGLLVLLQADGGIAWQKRTETYPLAPGGVKISLPYSRAVLDAAGNFLLVRNQPESATLLHLDATGTEVAQTPLLMPAETLLDGNQPLIRDLIPLPTGLFAYAGTNSRSWLVELSAQGLSGRVTPVSGGGSAITDFVPLPNNDLLLVSFSQLSRVQLYSGTVRWTRLATENPRVNPVRAARLPGGQLAVVGYTTYNSHLNQLIMRLFDENGQIVPAPGFPGQVEYSFGTSIYEVSAGGLYIHPTTGQLVAGGSVKDTPTQEKSFFLWSGPVAALFPSVVTAVSASQLAKPAAWPNPLSADGQLTVSAELAAGGAMELYNGQGRLVRSWPKSAAGPGSRQLPMHDLPAGLYLLSGRSAAGTPATLRIVKN